MRRVLVALGLALVLAPAAHAKGPIQVCGASSCVTFAPETAPPSWLFGGRPGAAVYTFPPPAAYYVIRFADVRAPLAYWIPSKSLLDVVSQTGVGMWLGATDDDRALLRDATVGVDPVAAPTRAQVYVNGDNAKGGRTYLRLLTIGDPVSPPTRVAWLPIWIGGVNSPWTDNRIDLRISRTGRYLFRNGLVFRIPLAIAQKVRRLQPLG